MMLLVILFQVRQGGSAPMDTYDFKTTSRTTKATGYTNPKLFLLDKIDQLA